MRNEFLIQNRRVAQSIATKCYDFAKNKLYSMDETLLLFYWNSSTSLKLSISDFSPAQYFENKNQVEKFRRAQEQIIFLS